MPRDSDQFDFFVSYARKDNTSSWVTAFVGRRALIRRCASSCASLEGPWPTTGSPV